MAKSTIKKLTPSNTKQEMLEAYSKLMEEVETSKNTEINASEKIEEKQIKEVIETADKLSLESINKKVSDLKFEFSTVLADLSDKIESEFTQYQQVKKAVTAKESELKEIFEIQKNAESLYALLEAQKQRKEEFELESENLRNELESEIEEKRSAWEKEITQKEIEIKDKSSQDLAMRSREKEEYLYKYKREHQIAQDKFETEKSALEKELFELKEKTMKEIDELKEKADKDLSIREKIISESEVELKDLRTKTSEFPKELASSIDNAIKSATEKILMESKHKEELLLSKNEGEKKVLEIKIEALEKTIKEQNEVITKYSNQLEKSYTQIQEIATNAVVGSSNKPLPINSQS
jgi:hypothetical protein